MEHELDDDAEDESEEAQPAEEEADMKPDEPDPETPDDSTSDWWITCCDVDDRSVHTLCGDFTLAT